ncbi:MAG: hypothetical protein Q4D54_00250 [Eubacteriales bacterium]|nr:hypothetical protein [Lachnospiraceae bacterium]MDO5126162.1 hypothetical protein [Eubacteriales bacterium]
MKYRKATQEDLKLLMDIRLEMLRKINALPDDYTFSESMILNIEHYFKEGPILR